MKSRLSKALANTVAREIVEVSDVEEIRGMLAIADWHFNDDFSSGAKDLR